MPALKSEFGKRTNDGVWWGSNTFRTSKAPWFTCADNTFCLVGLHNKLTTLILVLVDRMHSRAAGPYHHCHPNHRFTIILLISSRSLLSRAFLSSSSLAKPRPTRMSTSNQCAISFPDFLASQWDSPCLPNVILGNEAGDADSIISSLTLAYVESIYNHTKTPIVSVPRADLCLRRETVLLLNLAHVDTEKLRYIDDEEIFREPRFVTLVDHNRLTIDADWSVTEIVDHHFDEQSHEHVVGSLRVIAFENGKALVGSTCTLVAERLFTTLDPPYASQVSIALLGVILLDTVNMNPAAGKGTPRDQDAINELVSKTDWSTLPGGDFINQDGVIDTDKLYEKLSASKFDLDFWKQLSARDTLRLDYKRFLAPTGQVFGSSSILLDVDSFLTKPNVVEETISYMNESEIPLLAVLGLKVIGQFMKRELLLCGSDRSLVNNMADYILTNPAAKMAMQSEEKPVEKDTGALVVRHFQQGNPKASRKQVAPILLNFFSQDS